MRIGNGYDVHRLAPGQKLVLEAGASGTLGGLACSVSRSGSVGVGGDFSNLEPGRLVLFQRHGMVACRQGEAYCFVLPDDVNTGFRAPPMPDTDRADSGISGAHEAGAVAAAVGVASAALGGISAMQSGRDRVIPASGSISSGPAPEVRVIPASGSISSGPDENAEAGTVPLRVIPASGSITGGPTLSLSGLAQQALDEARVSGNQTRALLLAQVDCEQAGGEPELVLTAKHYDRIGSIHCGVPGAGFVVVGGDVASLEDGRAVLFTRHRIVVCRSGDEHRFLRLEPEQA
ncbi:MAG TPA: hypothetical protein PLN94_06025 [Thiolinea sp.]|nr:hypothetical protein [Thiolinea sp.]